MVAAFHSIPRVIISGLSGGSGKTFVSLGLAYTWTKQGKCVIPFKKGPDYIDAAWLSLASTKHTDCNRHAIPYSSCFCLDPFFLNEEELYAHFIESVAKERQSCDPLQASIALIEGNRGLFDGKDVQGSCSSARLAHLLQAPVIVSINCTKITRTVAALVMGLTNFDPDLNLAGVILNHAGTERHANIIRQSVEMYTDVPVLGVLPRMKNNPIPERHMGLHLQDQHKKETLLDTLSDFVSTNLDVDKIFHIAVESPLLEQHKHFAKEQNVCTLDVASEGQKSKTTAHAKTTKDANKKESINAICEHEVNIAYIYDDALWFYYRENLEALQKYGANLIPLSILDETPFAEQAKGIPFDALYIGGGFPELYAEQISKSIHLKEIQEMAENNLPIYAECGGFMLLSKCLHIPEEKEKTRYQMAEVFSAETEFFKRPQGLGYITAHTCIENPYHPMNSVWNGHEFHFSKSVNQKQEQPYVLSLNPGYGMQKFKGIGADGLLYKQCFAAYAHLFAPAVPHWAKNFVQTAQEFRKTQSMV